MDKNLKQIKPMTCPVCNRFYFSELNEDELANGETPNTTQCDKCGWFYDLEQLADPNLENQSNVLSLNQYKEEYKKKILQNPDYDYSEENASPDVPHKCPVCGEYIFDFELSYDICSVCGWNDDGCYDGSNANKKTLEEAIADFKKKRAENPNYKWIDTIEK